MSYQLHTFVWLSCPQYLKHLFYILKFFCINAKWTLSQILLWISPYVKEACTLISFEPQSLFLCDAIGSIFISPESNQVICDLFSLIICWWCLIPASRHCWNLLGPDCLIVHRIHHKWGVFDMSWNRHISQCPLQASLIHLVFFIS